MEYKVDYHFHSIYSDGTKKPTDLVKWYKDNGYDEIALTDHDGIDGVKEAKIAGETLGIQVVSGIELSTDLKTDFKVEPIDVHLLGYRFNEEDEALLSKLKDLKEFRKRRNEKLLEKLQEMGYELSYDDLISRPNQTYVGKPNIAQALVNKGYIEKYQDAFEEGRFLESPEIRAVKKEKLTTSEAISLVKMAGGIAVIAHPMEILEKERYFVDNAGDEAKESFFEWLFKTLKKLKKEGLSGIECYHPSASEEDSVRLIEIAEKLKLHVTSGSDYHGL
ncbi:MAG: PHP domain-containing protein [Clostridiales bacterium]|nr:PHP domain-containing protein [Clostridiales bacterium]MDD7347322.1 PHP domain-containing protein [Clostridiales bacterium]